MKLEHSLQTEIDAAENIRRQIFPVTGAMYFAGPIVRGEGTKHSDLDIVVVYDDLPAVYRESFIYSAMPSPIF